MGVNGGKALMSVYDGNVSTDVYSGEFLKVYNAVLKGNKIPEVSHLTPAQKQAAIFSAQNDLKSKNTVAKNEQISYNEDINENKGDENNEQQGRNGNDRFWRIQTENSQEQIASGTTTREGNSRSSNESWLHQRRSGKGILLQDSEGRRISESVAKGLESSAIRDDNGKSIALYHATDQEFDTFEKGDIGFHFGTLQQAEERAKNKGIDNPIKIRAYLNIKNPFYAKKDFMNWHANSVAIHLWADGVISEEQWHEVRNLFKINPNYDGAASILMREILEEKGYDGIAYPNEHEGEGFSYIAFYNEQIIRTETNEKRGKTDEQEQGLHLRYGSERPSSENTGGKISSVEKDTGRNQGRKNESGSQNSRETSLTYGEEISIAGLGVEGGLENAFVRTVTGGENDSMRKAKVVAKENDLEIVFFAGNNLKIREGNKIISAQGCYDPKTRRIFVRVDHPLFSAEQIARHEAGHDKIKRGEINIGNVRERLQSRYKGQITLLANLYNSAYAGSGMTPEEIWTEVICDSLGDMNIFSETEIESHVDELLTKTKEEALTQANTSRKKVVSENNSKKHNSMEFSQEVLLNKENFTRQLEDWRTGNGKKFGSFNGEYFKLGTTSDILVKHGAAKKELIMYDDCLVKITGGKHSISIEEIGKLPFELQDPVLLFKGNGPNSFVALTEITDKSGNEVIAIIHINKRHDRNVINKIASLYSKTDDFGVNHIKSYVMNQIKSGNLLDVSIKKAPMWFTSRGLQLPKLVQTIIDANINVSQKEYDVNSQYMQKSDKNTSIGNNSMEISPEDITRTLENYREELDRMISLYMDSLHNFYTFFTHFFMLFYAFSCCFLHL